MTLLGTAPAPQKFEVHLYGFDPVVVDAGTAAGAKYRAYKLGREAGYFSRGFHYYLTFHSPRVVPAVRT